MTETSGYAPVPGPRDRVAFFDAQRRHRRASWSFTALSAAAVALMGVPLSAVISPLLYALAVVVTDLVNLAVRTPDLLAMFGESEAVTSTGPLPAATIAQLVAGIGVPGSVALVLGWLGVRRLLRRVGAGAAVLALGAREPRGDVLEERQLVNVVGEMAAAAGVPVPKVMLLDSPVPNAAAVGTRIDDATVVVTTGLLEVLDRDQTQGVVAHVVGSVGNGDLRIGATISSVFQTLGLVGSVLRAPTERGPRKTLRRLLRHLLRRPGADDGAALAQLLTSAGADWEPDYTDKRGKEPGGFTSMVMLPFVVAGAAFMVTSTIFGWLVVNPFIRRAWRARRYLADATAVELTRNPDGLARALATLAERGDVVPGTEWAAHLFVVGRRGDPEKADRSPLTGFAPKPATRVERLAAMGASVTVPKATRSRGATAALAAVLVATSPCLLSFFVLMLGTAVLMTGISLMIDSLFLAPAVALIHVLLRGLVG
jgi:Zn-dependent protease with chaperone function